MFIPMVEGCILHITGVRKEVGRKRFSYFVLASCNSRSESLKKGMSLLVTGSIIRVNNSDYIFVQRYIFSVNAMSCYEKQIYVRNTT